MDGNNSYYQLQARLEALLKRQNQLAHDIEDLRSDIARCAPPKEDASSNYEPIQTTNEPKYDIPAAPSEPKSTNYSIKSNLEKFIGENLVSKIGIIITIIGVAIGIKYSIEHDLIRPSTRIIIGYLIGVALFGIGAKLKVKYKSYSSVLVSGAIAIMYFITFAGYAMYGIMPRLLAFALMIGFTAFAVYQAITYSRQVIATIGLVGAYAIPFLLGGDSKSMISLMLYIAIIDAGILIISLAKYWKHLFYTAFAITWIIYGNWHLSTFFVDNSFSMLLWFLCIYFVIFYITALAYKFIHCRMFGNAEIMLLLMNAFIFYSIGFHIIHTNFDTTLPLTVFTLINAALYGATGVLVYKRREADQNLSYLTIGLAMLFITIVIPVALDGSWVTLLWAGEALVLFAIGCKRQIQEYKKVAYPLMVLSFISLIGNWIQTQWLPYTPFFNSLFICSALFVAMFAAIAWLNYNDKSSSFGKTSSILIASILIISAYMLFYKEIANAFQIAESNLKPSRLVEISSICIYKKLSAIGYTMLFVTGVIVVNCAKIKDKALGNISLIAAIASLAFFLFAGLYQLSDLRDLMLHSGCSKWGFLSRYASIGIAILMAFGAYRYIKSNESQHKRLMLFDLIAYTAGIWLISSELLNITDIVSSQNAYRLGLSILWGVCSFSMIAIGILQKKKYLRIAAFALFGVTLIKLFTYDISHLGTISKTIVFLSLGILLLIISFLYNKFRGSISDQ